MDAHRLDRLKIAYLCDQSPLVPSTYSGGNTRMFKALQCHVGDVTLIDASWYLAEPVRRLMAILPEAVQLRARWRLHYALAPMIARGVTREIAKDQYDAVFCAYSLQSMSRVKTGPKVLRVFTSDATQTTYRQSEIGQVFGSYWSASRKLDAWVATNERRALTSMDLLLWPSEWLHNLCLETYGLRPDACRVIPWGAGIDTWPRPGQPSPIGRDHPLNLLVVGRDWFAKGGPVAFETMTTLRDRGIDARLTVIGCTPPAFHRSAQVVVHPSLDKTRASDMKIFEQVFDTAHVMVMPSHESYGFAFCEASAYGVPSLCLRVGGIPIRDGINGFALTNGSGPSDFADHIERLVADPDGYVRLRQTTRAEFETRLNWDSWGKQVAHLIADLRARQA